MSTYTIERVNGQFEVAVYERRWWWFKNNRSMVGSFERLYQAEECLLGIIGEAYSRKLDRDRFDPVSLTLAACEPRKSEEHVYTALVLQGLSPPIAGEMVSPGINDLAETMLGTKHSRVEERMFLHRFMTWYSKETPAWPDPRCLPHLEEFGNVGLNIHRPPSGGAFRRMFGGKR